MLNACGALVLLAFLGLACGEPERAASDPPAAISADEREGLAALGYADWSEPLPAETLARSGVTISREGRSFAGYNLYTSLPSPEAHLLDMRGEVVHTWSAPSHREEAWHHVEMTAEGEFFGLDDAALQKLDWHSRLLWEAPIRAHHDLDLDPTGRIYALGTRISRLGPLRIPIVDNEIVVLAPDGELERRIRFSEIFPRTLTAARSARIREYLQSEGLEDASDAKLLEGTPWPLDLFHANSIELLPRGVPGLGRAGSALVSLRTLNRVAVIDLDSRAVTWLWGGGVLDAPHHATLQPNGEVQVFDNGWLRGSSRVLRVTPGQRISWQYPERPGPGFFTKRRGAAQRLPNGNLLITESEKGRAFEIDPHGEIVWEFLNPEIDAGARTRAQIYRMERLPPSRVEPLLGREG